MNPPAIAGVAVLGGDFMIRETFFLGARRKVFFFLLAERILGKMKGNPRAGILGGGRHLGGGPFDGTV